MYYIYMTESLCCKAKINTTLQVKNTLIKNKNFKRKQIYSFLLFTFKSQLINNSMSSFRSGSTSLVIKNIQVKVMLRNHFTLSRTTGINNRDNNKYWKRYREMDPSYLAGRNVK